MFDEQLNTLQQTINDLQRECFLHEIKAAIESNPQRFIDERIDETIEIIEEKL